jgi:hypothetical protein
MSAAEALALSKMSGLTIHVFEHFDSADKLCSPDEWPCDKVHRAGFTEINGHVSDISYISTVETNPISSASIPVLSIPLHRSWEDLRRLARSIDFPIDEILVHQDGAFREDARAVQELRSILPLSLVPHITHLISMKRSSVAQGWNAAFRMFPASPYWLISAADIQLPAFSLERIHEEMTAQSRKGNHSNASVMYPLMACETPYCLFGVTRATLLRVGLFDENIFPAYFEDNDYDNRAALRGLHPYRMDVFVVHGDDSGVHKSGILRNYAKQRNWLKTKFFGDGVQVFYDFENRSAAMHYYFMKWINAQEGYSNDWPSKQVYFEWKIWRPIKPNLTTPYGLAGVDASFWVFNRQKRACALGLLRLLHAPDCSGYDVIPKGIEEQIEKPTRSHRNAGEDDEFLNAGREEA